MFDFKISLTLKVISSMLFLFSSLIWKRILQVETQNYYFIFYRVITTLSVLLLIILGLNFFIPNNPCFNFEIPNNVHFIDWIGFIVIGLFSFWGLYFYTKALQNGRFIFVAPLVTISSVFSIVTSVLLYDESLNTSKIIAILFIFTGLLWHQKDYFKSVTFSKEVFFIVLFSLVWGVSFVLYLIPIKKIGVMNFSVLLEFCVFISCVVLLLYHEKKMFPPRVGKHNLLLCLLMGVLVAGGSLLSNFTLTQFSVGLNIIIGLVFEMITIIVGLMVYSEKLNKNDWVLILLVSVGGFLILL